MITPAHVDALWAYALAAADGDVTEALTLLATTTGVKACEQGLTGEQIVSVVRETAEDAAHTPSRRRRARA